MSNSRRVRFSPSSRGSTGHRSREPGHDSGVGSSSSEQASFGGRPDRRFTAEDYEDQVYNIGALQEALGQANKKVEHFQQKCVDLDAELSRAHRVARDTDKLYREECDRVEKLERINKSLHEERIAQEEQIRELKADYDTLRDERDEYRQKYLTLAEPVIESTMRGGSGEPSSPRLRRTGSKRDGESKGTSKRHSGYGEEKGGPSRHHRRSSSLSVQPGGRSSSKRPYIEKMPEAPGAYAGNYTTAPIDYKSVSPVNPIPSSIPRGSRPASYQPEDQQTGDYVPYPLHDRRGEQRGRRK
ncbi:hypothetical protein F5Y04DRAFT_222387 [Hypomontagnella monticulosa]|nr:hypothetical protein F5Y04DRAFT_222387 [Hypomontagnella monticulosa]